MLTTSKGRWERVGRQRWIVHFREDEDWRAWDAMQAARNAALAANSTYGFATCPCCDRPYNAIGLGHPVGSLFGGALGGLGL